MDLLETQSQAHRLTIMYKITKKKNYDINKHEFLHLADETHITVSSLHTTPMPTLTSTLSFHVPYATDQHIMKTRMLRVRETN